MKKNKILLFVAILLCFAFVGSFFVQIQNINLSDYWLSTAMLCIGLYSLTYFELYGMDSSLYYGTLITLSAVVNFVQNIFLISTYVFYPMYILCFSLASFAVFVIFRQNIHFKLFAILTIQVILLVSYKMNYLNIWQVVFINALYLLTLLIRTIFRIRKNLRRVK